MKSLNPRLIPPSGLELIALRFKALSEVSRLKILISLESGEKNVSSLVDATGLSQTNLSRHLQTLVEAGLLSRRREGLAVIYAIADPAIFKICGQVCAGLARQLEAKAAVFTGK